MLGGDIEDIYCNSLVDNQKYSPIRFIEKEGKMAVREYCKKIDGFLLKTL